MESLHQEEEPKTMRKYDHKGDLNAVGLYIVEAINIEEENQQPRRRLHVKEKTKTQKVCY